MLLPVLLNLAIVVVAVAHLRWKLFFIVSKAIECVAFFLAHVERDKGG
jgi:hypothetical protein